MACQATVLVAKAVVAPNQLFDCELSELPICGEPMPVYNVDTYLPAH